MDVFHKLEDVPANYGPAYVSGPVRVVGIDVYDMDADGDGVGCD